MCSSDLAEYLVDVDALVQALGGRVVLVGHSMGGTIASLYAGIRPEAVAGLVILDGLGLPDGLSGTMERWRAHLDGHRSLRPPRTLGSVEEAMQRILALHPMLDERHARLLAERGTRPVEGGVAWSTDPRHRLRMAVPYRQDQHAKLLSEVRCPVLLVWPETPAFAEEDIRRLTSLLPMARQLVVPNTTHALHMQAPVSVAEAIRALLQVLTDSSKGAI